MAYFNSVKRTTASFESGSDPDDDEPLPGHDTIPDGDDWDYDYPSANA